MTKVVICTPAFDEWANLGELMPKIEVVLGELGDCSHWIVISESQISENHFLNSVITKENIKVIPRQDPENSFGSAIQTGIDSLGDDDEIVVFMDGDQSHDPSQILKMVEILERQSDVDLVIASRYVRGGSSDNPWPLRVMSRMLNLVYRAVLGLRASDLSTNFKAYRTEHLKGVHVLSRNFETVEELLVHVSVRLGRHPRIVEIPDHFAQRRHGSSKRKLGQFIGTYLFSILRIRKSVRQQYGTSKRR